MQTYLLLPFGIFLSLLEWIVIIDFILSWLSLVWLQIVIPFFRMILNPIYDSVARYLPVRFMGIDFSPVIVLIAIDLLMYGLVIIDPTLVLYFPSLLPWK